MTDYDYDEYNEDNWDYDPDYDDWMTNGYGDSGVTYFYEGDDIEMSEEYYDNWNPEVNPPALYTCRVCNGMGNDPYSMPCETCEGTGWRYPTLYRWLNTFRLVKIRIWNWFNCLRRPRFCRVCKRFYIADDNFCTYQDCENSFPF